MTNHLTGVFNVPSTVLAVVLNTICNFSQGDKIEGDVILDLILYIIVYMSSKFLLYVEPKAGE